jgi:branched-chain amino acid transport system substrate-binding protein
VRRLIVFVLLVLVLLALPVAAAACSGSSATTTTARTATTAGAGGGTTTPSATDTTAAAVTETTAAPIAETLRIAALISTQSLGNDMKRGIEVMADIDNATGGIQIGDKKYRIEFDFIESNNDEATAVSAVKKLVDENKDKFLLTDTGYPQAVFAETEKNKVLTVSGTSDQAMFDPRYNYTFLAGTMMQAIPEVAGWIGKNQPEIKTVALAFPDEPGAVRYAADVQATLESYGKKVNPIKYSSTAPDMTALGAAVIDDDPSAFVAVGNSATDLLAYQAVVQAGFEGRLFSTTTVTYEALKTAVPAEALEGFIGGAWPVEFDPAATDVAKEFKAKWIEKYGKWDGPDIQLTSVYAALRAALQKAGTLDADKVAEVIAGGLVFEGPTGKGMMIPRNDLGISRTVDNISEFCIKKIVNGAPIRLHYITLDEGKGYVNPAAFAAGGPSSSTTSTTD